MEGSLIAGRYRLDSKIGEGGLAAVYRGLDITLERVVAVKILRPDMATDEDAVTRFRREAHSAAKLSHPNIIQLFDTGVDGDVYYIVMEYLPEPDLKRIIREYAPLPLRKVLEVSIQCARALAYAHRQGLVHRDVKPHNILFTDDGRVKLSDFGIAAAAGEQGLTADGLVLGSAYYISPEQAQGGPATAQSDIYSLGVVMFECITGRVPFAGATAAEIAAKHVRERPPALRSLNPAITPSAEFVINKAMAREAARRYRSADEMLVDLEKLADGVELDRTGVLGIPTEDATLTLAPTQAPVMMEAPVLLRPVAPTMDQRQPVLGPASRAPARAPGSMAAVTVAAVLVALLALGGVAWLLRTVLVASPAARKVNVPAVKGMALAEARAEITKAGLRPGNVSYVEADSAPNGTVIEQAPGMGEMVEPGSAVNLTLSRGKQTVTVPDVSQRSVAEATERLQAANLHLGEMERIFHETVPAGLVVKQAIASGTKVEAGTAIDLTVSKGPEQPPTTVATGPVTTPGTDATPANDPEVEVREDETFRSDNPAERQLLVKVSAMGTQMGQRIQIIKSDDKDRDRAVVTVTMDPGASKEFPVKVVGNGTLEVHLDGRRVFSAPCPINAPQ
jgi:eukaryotic-like serine/threonine-protein kinase